MNNKIMLIAALAVFAACFGVLVMEESEDSDAVSLNAKTLYNAGSQTYTYPAGTSISIQSVLEENGQDRWIPSPSSLTVSSGSNTSVTISYYENSNQLVGTVTATFAAEAVSTYTVTFQSNNSSYGTVSRSTISNVPSGSSISVSGNTVTINGTTVTASAATDTAQYDYGFSSWSNTSGSVTADRTITANFTRSTNSYTVSFYASPSGYGSVSRSTVTSVPYGTYFSVSGSSVSINGTSVTATAATDTAQYDYSFDSWSVTSSSRVTGNTSVYAYFDRDVRTYNAVTNVDAQYVGCSVTMSASGYSSVTATAGGGSTSLTVDYGTTVTWTATAGAGYSFVKWTIPVQGTETTSNPASETITGLLGFIPVFEATATYTVTFQSNEPGYGSVSQSTISSVPSGSSITVSGNTVTINGTTVTASAATDTAQYDYGFSSWSNTSGSVTADRTITANFTRSTNTYTASAGVSSTAVGCSVTLSAPGYTSVTVTPGNVDSLTVDYNTEVTWTATAGAGYRFVKWTINGADATTDNPTSDNMTSSYTLIAVFQEAPTFNAGAGVSSTATGCSVTISASGYSPVTVTAGNTGSLNVVTGTDVTWTATAGAGYRFVKWTINGADATTDNPTSDNMTSSYTLIAVFEEIPTYNAGAGVSSTAVGCSVTLSAVGYSPVTVTAGNVDSLNVVTGTDVTWTAIAGEGFQFVKWVLNGADATTDNPTTDTMTSSYTLVAVFQSTVVSDAVYWSNNNYNGKIDLIYQFDASDNKTHTMLMDLYTPTVSGETTTWNLSDYTLQIDLSYPKTVAEVTLYENSTAVKTNTLTVGKWSTFVVTIDTNKGNVAITPIKTFGSFIDFTLYDNQRKVVLDFSDEVKGAAVFELQHEDSAAGTNPARFSVYSTEVFLDTYGIVLYNPTINLYDYFPQYESIRVNFYSFALYGDSITINGTTYDLDGAYVTVQYQSTHDMNYLPGTLPNDPVKTKTMELSNIYVTYDSEAGHVYLTFVNDRFTIDLGAYTEGNETISMSGLWYFASTVYEPYTATEKKLGDWEILPTISKDAMILIYLGVLTIAGVFIAIHARSKGLGMVDIAIITAAALVGLIMLGY